MEQEPQPRVPGTAPSFLRAILWFAMAAVATAALSFIAATVPPRVKLLGLFMIVQGALAGSVLGWLAKWNDFLIVRAVVPLSFLLIAVSLIGTTLEAHRRYAAAVREAYTGDPQTAIMLRALSQPRGNEPGGSDANDLFRKAVVERQQALAGRTSLSAYLKRRVEPFGDWPTAAAVLCWIAEVLAGSFAGTWMARYVGRNTR